MIWNLSNCHFQRKSVAVRQCVHHHMWGSLIQVFTEKVLWILEVWVALNHFIYTIMYPSLVALAESRWAQSLRCVAGDETHWSRTGYPLVPAERKTETLQMTNVNKIEETTRNDLEIFFKLEVGQVRRFQCFRCFPNVALRCPGYIPIPKSINPERILLNMAGGFDLTKQQMVLGLCWNHVLVDCLAFGSFKLKVSEIDLL